MGYFFFFFSSRRRHTRSLCDWSSDVCSSDLEQIIRLADDLFLVLIEADEDAFLTLLQPAPDELGRERGLARTGPTDHYGRAVLVHPSVEKRVESVDSAANFSHAISSRREL